MIYKITIRPKAIKFIDKQDKIQKIRIYKAIYNLPSGDIKKMAGYENIFRLRVGDYRIIYEKNDTEFIILITSIHNRGQVYRNFFFKK